MKLPTIRVRTTGTVLVEMVEKNGLSDKFSLTRAHRFRSAFLSSLLFSSLIVNKSSVKLWDSGQDSCSFENVN